MVDIASKLEASRLDLPAAAYHRHEALSCSRFLAMGEWTEDEMHWDPAQYHAPPTEPTEAMELGTILHAMYYEPDTASSIYAVRPTDAKGRLVACDTEQYAEWAAEHPGKIHLHPKHQPTLAAELDILRSAKQMPAYEAHYRHPIVSTETSYLARISGIDVRIKPDRLRVTDRGAIIIEDLKRSDPNPVEFERHARSFRYWRRADFYIRAIQSIVGEDVHCVYRFIVISGSSLAIYQASDRRLAEARMQNDAAFAAMKRHIASNDFRPIWQTGVYVI